MNVLIVSDTHGRSERLFEAVQRARADVLLFLGDGLRDLAAVELEVPEIYAVKGNCDFFSFGYEREERLEVLGGYRIFMTHGHRYGAKQSIAPMVARAAALGADVLLYGHTHEPFEKTLPRGTKLQDGTLLQKSLLVVCPGSLGQPREGAPTFATLTLRRDGVLAGFGKL